MGAPDHKPFNRGGQVAALVDGKMVDCPVLRVRNIVEAARWRNTYRASPFLLL